MRRPSIFDGSVSSVPLSNRVQINSAPAGALATFGPEADQTDLWEELEDVLPLRSQASTSTRASGLQQRALNMEQAEEPNSLWEGLPS